MNELTANERFIISTLRAHVAHGYGRMEIDVHQGLITLTEGRRHKLALDKK